MIETERLLLRRWRESDVDAHLALTHHAAVVAMLGPPPSREASEQIVARQNEIFDMTGRCFWAVEHRESGQFIGWCGIKPGLVGTPIAELSEIGWTLTPAYWGQGLARDAALATLGWTWATTEHVRVYAITTPGNARSWGLMERLGMRRVADGDFDHPNLPKGDPLRRHLTYVIERHA